MLHFKRIWWVKKIFTTQIRRWYSLIASLCKPAWCGWCFFISYLGFLLILKDGTFGSGWRGWEGLVIRKHRILLDNTWKWTRTPLNLICQQHDPSFRYLHCMRNETIMSSLTVRDTCDTGAVTLLKPCLLYKSKHIIIRVCCIQT